jgi:hypothetical protein
MDELIDGSVATIAAVSCNSIASLLLMKFLNLKKVIKTFAL